MKTKLIISILFAGVLIATSVQAQMAISQRGITFSDGSYQDVAPPKGCSHGEYMAWDAVSNRGWKCESELSTGPYGIGDRGPAGGFIFYLTLDGRHGFEAAPNDASNPRASSFPWGCRWGITGANGLQVGTGKDNTADILPCTTAEIAPRIADEFEFNGYSDWFLPSIDALFELYRINHVIGANLDGDYWSSSEFANEFGWALRTSEGKTIVTDKNGFKKVRPIRAF